MVPAVWQVIQLKNLLHKCNVHGNHFSIFCHFRDLLFEAERFNMSSTEHKAAIHFPTLCISVSPKGKSCSLIPGNFIYFPLLCEMAICSPNISQVSLETKCTKDPSWGLGVNSLLYSLLPPHPIKLSHSSHKSQWNYTVAQNCTFSTSWANPVGHLILDGKDWLS